MLQYFFSNIIDFRVHVAREFIVRLLIVQIYLYSWDE